MKSKILLSIADNDRYRILSPAVGNYSDIPKNNTFLSAGSFAGQLTILNTTFNLYLPRGVFGRVCHSKEVDKSMAVEYEQELFSLQADSGTLAQANNREESSALPDELQGKGTVISAFTTGIFYRRSSPDAPPFVSEGEKIKKGKVMGLIEVMKAFNQLIFQGADNDDGGFWKIKKILVEDAAEVKLGEPLFLIEKIK